MRKVPFRILELLGVSLFLLGGCGGSPKRPAQTEAPKEETTAKIEQTEQAPAPTPAGPNCGDGSCITCGDALCPQGFFCDETSGKPNCQWVASCRNVADCACVSRTLSSSCTCTDRNGGAYVRCK